MIGNCIWICVEGIDGAGKTSQIRKLKKYYEQKGYRCFVSHIFDTDFGEYIRDFFLSHEDLSVKEEIMMLMLARVRYIEKIKKISKRYDIVITDRMFLSIESMQGKEECDYRMCKKLRDYIMDKFEIDLTIILDIPVETAFERKGIGTRESTCDRIEKKDTLFHNSVRERFLNLGQREKNTVILNGNQEISNVFADMVEVMDSTISGIVQRNAEIVSH